MTKTLILTLGGKGGVGKTVALGLLADYLLQKNIAFSGVDADTENSGKPSCFNHYFDGDLPQVNLRNPRDCDQLLEAAASSEAPFVLADLPANSGAEMHRWFADVVKSEVLAELNVKLIGVGCITPSAGTVQSVVEWANALGDRCSYVVALNYQLLTSFDSSPETTFPDYFTSKAGTVFRKQFKPVEIVIPGLLREAMDSFTRAGKLPTAAVSDTGIPLLVRQRIKTWTKIVHDQLDKTELLK